MASCVYVRWEEVWVSREKGRREVHYVLRRRDGSSDLALVGKEKSLRHMFYHYALPTQKKLLASMGSSVSFSKLKSRKEVVDWLDSLFSDSSAENSARAADAETLKVLIMIYEAAIGFWIINWGSWAMVQKNSYG